MQMTDPSATPPTSVTPAWSVEGLGAQPEALFLKIAAEHGYIRSTEKHQATALDESLALPEGLGELRLEVRNDCIVQAVFERDSLCVKVQLRHESVHIAIAGPVDCRLEREVEDALARFPAPDGSASVTPATFWSYNEGRPRREHRRLEARVWAELRDGYEPDAALELDRLTELGSPDEQGSLLLWHGAPGTGKTNAIRALAHAWREWCALHVVTDVDRLLGGETAYPMSVIASPDGERQANREWKLIVLEDAGELIGIEARDRSGQGLSRLLNLTDGLLGSGSKALFLITTNEPLGSLHPAVHRPGRCLSELEIGPLSVEQTNRWLAEHQVNRRVDVETTLAELYALKSGRAISQERARVGFAA